MILVLFVSALTNTVCQPIFLAVLVSEISKSCLENKNLIFCLSVCIKIVTILYESLHRCYWYRLCTTDQ